jgi:hypothetical protein
MPKSLLATLIALASIFQISTSTAAPKADPTRLFDWAEKTYPNYFPSHVISASATYGTDTFIYRYYPKTRNYLGLNLRNCGVYVLGTLTDGDLLFINYFSQFKDLADGDCF